MLLVDDFNDLLFIASEFLSQLIQDIEIVTCECARDALEKLDEGNFDIIVSDFQMPQMDGLEFLEVVRKDGNEIPFIIFTGMGREEVAIKSLNLGATHYLKKGGEPESQFAALAHHIKTAVHHRRSEIALHESEAKYRSLFEDSAVSMLEEDFSRVKNFFDEKRAEGITDFRDYFENYPEDVEKCVTFVNILDLNKASMIMYGVEDKQELIGPLDRIFTRDALDVFREELISLAEGNILFISDLQIIEDIKGRTHARIFQLNVPPGYENTLAKVHLSIIDMTERYQSEQLAEQERMKAETYLELSRVMFVALDAKGRIDFVNSHTCTVMGYEEEELIGKDWFDLALTEREVSEVKGVFNNIMSGKLEKVDYFENTIVTKSGEERVIAWHNIYIVDESGNIGGTLSSGEDITDRKTMVETLRESEERFRKFFDNAPVYFYMVTPDGKIMNASQEALKVLGYSKDELVGQPVMSIYAPEALSKMKDLLQTWKETGHIDEIETTIITKNGERRNVILLVDAQYTSEGELINSISIQVDITDRVIAEQQLERTQAMLNAVIGQTPLPILLMTADKRIEIINEASKKQIEAEHRPSFVKGANWEKIERPQRIFDSEGKAIKNEDRAMARALRGERTVKQEYRIERVDGTTRWEEIDGLPIYDDAGNVIAGLVIFPEITERKRVEEELETSEEMFRLLTGSMKEGILVVDQERNVRYSNSQYEMMWRVPKEIMDTKDDVKILNFVLDQLIDPLDYLDKVGNLYNSQDQNYTTIVLKDGRIFNRYSFPIRSEEKTKGRAWVFRDISDEVSIDDKIKREREALSDFAHRMSHELRNRLSAIKGYAVLLEKDYNQGNIESIKKLVEKSMNLMSRSVLLADAGLIIGNMSHNSLDRIVDGVISEVLPDEVHIEKDTLPFVMCDRLKVAQVFRNILKNAIEHGSARKIEIRSIDNIERKCILIKNDGEPISEAHHDKIFIEGFTTKKDGGIGLGIVKKIVEAHDWSISLDRGVPTCFRIFIPNSNLS